MLWRHLHIYLSPWAQVFACLAKSSSHIVARKVQVSDTNCVKVGEGQAYVLAFELSNEEFEWSGQ